MNGNTKIFFLIHVDCQWNFTVVISGDLELPDCTATLCSSNGRVVHKFSLDESEKEYLKYLDLPD